MNTHYKNWLIDKDDKHIITLTLDKPETTTNVLSQSVLSELQLILDDIKHSQSRALIFKSAKKNSFIAGADVTEFSKFSNNSDPYGAALGAIQQGQLVMNSIESLAFPSFALINGFCLGGGMELALACDYRIALDHEKTKFGLPEIKLGIHPGFGGTVRTIQLMGIFKAMKLMLSGRIISALAAKKMGLIDEVVAQRHFDKSVLQWLNNGHLLKHIAKKQTCPGYYSLLETDVIRPFVAYILEKNVKRRVIKKHYPAPYALIKLWKQYGGSYEYLMKKEAESVASLINSEVAQNLIRVFHLQNQLKELSKADANKKIPLLEHIHIIGAGVMGGDIAIWCAYKGFTVTVHDRRNEVLAQLIHRADTFLKRKVKNPRLMQNIMDRLIPDINNHGLKKADLIIEAIIEDVKAKQQVFKEAEKMASPQCIFASNTSSIPLDEISIVLKEPSRLVGLHFFNPVAKMPLVEVVSSQQTTEHARQTALIFSGMIGKLPLPVTSTPGFLVNRILMPYLLEAIVLYSEGFPAAYIDKAATDFGMPMGPIELADKVGLDICLSVANILIQSQHDSSSRIPKILNEMVKDGHTGLKARRGFYRYKNNKLIKTAVNYHGLSLSQISNRLMFRLFNEAVACLDEKVVASADHLDAGIIFGTGFAPFLGGPMHYIKHTGFKEMDHRLIDLSKDYGKRFTPTIGWQHLMPLGR